MATMGMSLVVCDGHVVVGEGAGSQVDPAREGKTEFSVRNIQPGVHWIQGQELLVQETAKEKVDALAALGGNDRWGAAQIPAARHRTDVQGELARRVCEGKGDVEAADIEVSGSIGGVENFDAGVASEQIAAAIAVG